MDGVVVGSDLCCALIEDITDSDLINSVTRAFALAHISEGHPCSEAIEAYKRPYQQQIIRDTYIAVAKSCETPSDAVRQKAGELLNDVEVRQR